ncbi:unnamed protein product [Mycena citricolor]|uniref:AB hydrolase-1 domain-containing protein n=1 Tax=Mycena citricolor TaxID=2018698 RepID=A0AAD2K3N5_9AGAR|nr:unnamed protein product [Mycena citricolor]CAK5277031.1 unnamed protein product [Mycena citricolor]
MSSSSLSSHSIALQSTSHIFDARPRYPHLLTAKRYRAPSYASPPGNSDPRQRQGERGVTLVLAHGSGFHKEHYEPVIEDLHRLIAVSSATSRAAPRIDDIWAVDHPSHGEAAILNEEAFHRQGRMDDGAREYGRALHAFLTLPNAGIDVDFSKRRLVLVGHSMGAMAVILALLHPARNLRPECLVAAELVSGDPELLSAIRSALARGCAARQDVWGSREEAALFVKRGKMWAKWDPRVVEIFLAHGLRSLPTLKYPHGGANGVTLTCTVDEEESTSRDVDGALQICESIRAVAEQSPTHLIYGAVNDVLSQELKNSLIARAGGPRNLGSVVFVPGAGHLIAQSHPSKLAESIYNILNAPPRSKPPSFKMARL